MLLADELEIRYKKSSTTSMATTLSPLSVRIEILGFALLFHSYIIIHPYKDKAKLFLSSKVLVLTLNVVPSTCLLAL